MLGSGLIERWPNTEWIDCFSDASVQHLTSPRSDHKILMLSTRQVSMQGQPPKAFRYEIMWEREEELGSIIEKAWQKKNPGSDLGALADALKRLQRI